MVITIEITTLHEMVVDPSTCPSRPTLTGFASFHGFLRWEHSANDRSRLQIHRQTVRSHLMAYTHILWGHTYRHTDILSGHAYRHTDILSRDACKYIDKQSGHTYRHADITGRSHLLAYTHTVRSCLQIQIQRQYILCLLSAIPEWILSADDAR